MQTDVSPLLVQAAAARNGNLRCPHCYSDGKRRHSDELIITLRIVHFICTNDYCGHRWRARLEYEYGLCPSAIPNPQMAHLPLLTPTREEVMAAKRKADRLLMGGSQDDINQMDLFDSFVAAL